MGPLGNIQVQLIRVVVSLVIFPTLTAHPWVEFFRVMLVLDLDTQKAKEKTPKKTTRTFLAFFSSSFWSFRQRARVRRRAEADTTSWALQSNWGLELLVPRLVSPGGTGLTETEIQMQHNVLTTIHPHMIFFFFFSFFYTMYIQ